MGVAYSSVFHVVGGVPPYTVTEIPTRSFPGTLPAGLALEGMAATGTPLEGGGFNPLFQFTDSAGTPNVLSLTQYPFINGVSGAKGRAERPGLDELMKAVARRDVDMVAAWSVDRLGRSLQGLLEILVELRARWVPSALHRLQKFWNF